MRSNVRLSGAMVLLNDAVSAPAVDGGDILHLPADLVGQVVRVSDDDSDDGCGPLRLRVRVLGRDRLVRLPARMVRMA